MCYKLEQAVFTWLAQNSILNIKPNILIEIYIVKCSPVKVIMHNLIADGIDVLPIIVSAREEF